MSTLRDWATLQSISLAVVDANATERCQPRTFLLICCRGLSACWQLLTRWPRTHASQAYFSPLINMSMSRLGLLALEES